MATDIHAGSHSHSTPQSEERESAPASPELHLLDLDDLCLSEILVRAVPPQLPWESDRRHPIYDNVRREGESVVFCGRVLRVCRRFRNALLSRATGRCVCNSDALLRFAPKLRRLEIARDIRRLPWRAERSGDGVTIAPAALANLANVTQLCLRMLGLSDAGKAQDFIALPLLRDLELSTAQITEGPELQGLAALTALTRLHLPYLVASAPPHSLPLEGFSRLQALQDFGAPRGTFSSSSILRFIAALTALSALNLEGVYFRTDDGQLDQPAEHDALLEIVSQVCGLRELRYYYLHVTADGLSRLARSTQLTVLDLSKRTSHLSDRDLQPIAALPRLRKLDLTGDGCAQVPPLGELTALESLSLDVDEPSGGQRAAGLSALTHLQLGLRIRPRLRRPPQRFALGQPAIEALATLSSLRELALCNFSFEGAAGAAVGGLHGLRRLSLESCAVTDGALGALTQLHELTLLWDETEVGAMSQLTLLTGLRVLAAGGLSDHMFDCAGTAMMTQLSRLELIVLHDSSLVELSRLNSLQDLTVSAPSIGQQGLDSVAALHLLTRLSVSCERAFTGTVSRLTVLQRLVALNLDFRSSVAAEDVAAMACALPELRLLYAKVGDFHPSEVLDRLAHLRGTLSGACKLAVRRAWVEG